LVRSQIYPIVPHHFRWPSVTFRARIFGGTSTYRSICSDQILHGDKARWGETFYRSTTSPTLEAGPHGSEIIGTPILCSQCLSWSDRIWHGNRCRGWAGFRLDHTSRVEPRDQIFLPLMHVHAIWNRTSKCVNITGHGVMGREVTCNRSITSDDL